jgi:hypothetical protein
VKDRGPPNWVRYDKSGRVVERRWYSIAPPVAYPDEPPVHIDCPKRCAEPRKVNRGINTEQDRLI